jgi:hypothetical protein
MRRSADLVLRDRGRNFCWRTTGPPTKPDFSTDSFKLYRELRDCLNDHILKAMEVGDVNYINRAVLNTRIIKDVNYVKDGIYIYVCEEFGSFTIASHLNNIHIMKSGILKLLKFIIIMPFVDFFLLN